MVIAWTVDCGPGKYGVGTGQTAEASGLVQDKPLCAQPAMETEGGQGEGGENKGESETLKEHLGRKLRELGTVFDTSSTETNKNKNRMYGKR